jgi:hypothetical protein
MVAEEEEKKRREYKFLIIFHDNDKRKYKIDSPGFSPILSQLTWRLEKSCPH